ncbi:hypothetical protein CDD83_8488 [Cordyceps sp. RAO-2017]|nr:hypothetical protein CDD83_8488 [Cordyceps sp. RAO-2017]
MSTVDALGAHSAGTGGRTGGRMDDSLEPAHRRDTGSADPVGLSNGYDLEKEGCAAQGCLPRARLEPDGEMGAVDDATTRRTGAPLTGPGSATCPRRACPGDGCHSSRSNAEGLGGATVLAIQS